MIHIRGLAKQYGSHAVLRGIDLDVPAGQFLVVLGPSGAGKSTLLRCLNGLVQPSSGELRVAGFDATDTRARQVRQLRRQVAMIFQHHNVVPRLSVLKNTLTGRLGQASTLASILQLFSRQDIALALDCLRRVELEHKAHQRTDALSGGQRQRVGIARALAQQPQVSWPTSPLPAWIPRPRGWCCITCAPPRGSWALPCSATCTRWTTPASSATASSAWPGDVWSSMAPVKRSTNTISTPSTPASPK